MRDLTENEVEFTLTCEPEDISYKGNCSAIDDETDREQEQWIEDQLDRGNQWAWCQVTVTARWKGFKGQSSLGGCSYKSEKDFRQGGYFEDMKAEAMTELNKAVHAAREALAELD